MNPTPTPRTVTEAGGCFAAGTLVHTKDGLKPIEQIQVGDWVLSKPESGEGEQVYKRVVNTFSFENKVVRRIRYSVMRDGKWQHECLIATENHSFWVTGVDKSEVPKDDWWDHFWDDIKFGWTCADELFSRALIELSTGQQARVTSDRGDRLWKTEQPDVAWEAWTDSEKGYLLAINNGQAVVFENKNNRLVFHPDYRDDGDFVDRLSEQGLDEKWLYRCKVYYFEVEDFHTYYVGNLGAWVHNTNCHAKTVWSFAESNFA